MIHPSFSRADDVINMKASFGFPFYIRCFVETSLLYTCLLGMGRVLMIHPSYSRADDVINIKASFSFPFYIRFFV